ncbi:unnamed protein product [Choristocarpus tenellus]
MAEKAGTVPPSFLVSLVSGGVAGTSVDVALYPLDTIKTRLQAPQGFLKAGGFRGVYRGISAAAIGSAPGAALFFSAYETSKGVFGSTSPVSHMAAASIGEMVACLVRVPTENVKQKMQAGLHASAPDTIRAVLGEAGPLGLYTGFLTTVMREIPFSLVQFPLYERLKIISSGYIGRRLEPHESAVCGSVSGAFAAAVTTPVDVVKTRLMLGKDKHGVQYRGMFNTFRRIYVEEGGKALLSGLSPRVTWIGIGGSVFFGMYELSKEVLTNHL